MVNHKIIALLSYVKHSKEYHIAQVGQSFIKNKYILHFVYQYWTYKLYTFHKTDFKITTLDVSVENRLNYIDDTVYTALFSYLTSFN